MLRFTLTNECFSISLLRNPMNVCWNPQNRAHYSETINLRGQHVEVSLKNEHFSHLSAWKLHKWVLELLEQGLFFQDNWFEWVICLCLLWKMNIFPSYLLGSTINVCWNSQNRARFSKTIGLRGHMPRFTLKMNMFSDLSPEKPHKYVSKSFRTGLVFPRWSIWGVHMPRFSGKMNIFPSICLESV